MNRQILNFENQVRDGRLTELDRLNFMEQLGFQVMRMFKPIETMEGPKDIVDRESYKFHKNQTLQRYLLNY